MKQFSLITLCAVILASCTSQIPRPITGLTADFTYTIKDKTVTFVNNSSQELKAHQWFFGDDTYVENKETVTHLYSKYGTYEVTLTCKDVNGYPHDCTKTITIGNGGSQSAISKVYLKGYKIYDLPYSSGTYRFRCNIYDWSGVAYSYTTNDQTISTSDLAQNAKTLTFNDPKYITTSDRFYIDYTAVELVVLRKQNGSWKEIFKKDAVTEGSKTEYYFYNNAANLEVSVLFDYVAP